MQKPAFIFPGQGSQKEGMLAELGAAHSIVLDTFLSASEVLGYDLWELTQADPENQLSQTEVTQPAILTSSVAIWRLWLQEGGIKPTLMAGHSLGEYSALVCAGVLSFEDAVGLVQLRGQYMQSAVPAGVGGMAAIVGLDDETVIKACSDAEQGQVVSAVNFNSPGQVVIAGHAEAVARASELCKEAGAKRALPLPVSAPFHCALMKPAADEFSVDLQKVTFNSPETPVVQNYSLNGESNPDIIRENLVAQIYSPVPWVATIEKFASEGVDAMFEIGPGSVLSGLAKRINRDIPCASINTVASLESALELLK